MNATSPEIPLGRLPFEMREHICELMRDRHTWRQINDWLSGRGLGPYNAQNFTNFRQTHFKRWLDQQADLDETRRAAETVRRSLAADGDTIFDKLAFEFAEAAVEARKDATTDNVAKLASAAASIIQARTSQLRAADAMARTAIEKKRFQRDTTELFVKWMADTEARSIAAAPIDHSAKIAALGRHIFKEDWDD